MTLRRNQAREEARLVAGGWIISTDPGWNRVRRSVNRLVRQWSDRPLSRRAWLR